MEKLGVDGLACSLLVPARKAQAIIAILHVMGFSTETLELMRKIDRVLTKHLFFGSSQIAARHRVRRLMRPEAVYKRSNTCANQLWCAYIIYIPVERGVLYLVAIMDWATRKMLSWRL